MTPRPHALYTILPWLAISVAAHAALLSLWHGGAPNSAEAATATTLRLHLASQAHPVQTIPTSPAPIPRKPRQAMPKPEAAQPIPERHNSDATIPLPAAASTATAANAAVITMDVPDLSASTTATNAQVPDNNGWIELASLLHHAIDHHKHYPQSALRLGREGSARIDFRLDPDGTIGDLIIVNSSGMHALDVAAYHAVQGIAPFADAKRYLDHARRFQVDVVFSIN